jgi:uncharacterized protein
MSDAYAIMAWDGPDSATKRNETRAQHFAHIETIMDRILIAGPLKDGDGAMIGSLVVVTAKDASEAEAILKSDPYYAAGVWQRWDIQSFVPAAGAWVGGKTW